MYGSIPGNGDPMSKTLRSFSIPCVLARFLLQSASWRSPWFDVRAFNAEIKNPRDRRIRRPLIAGRIFRQQPAAPSPDIQVQPELMAAPLLRCQGKRHRSAAAVRAYTALASLAHFHACRGELDESFQHLSRRASSAFDMPEIFPDFVRFPIIACVEELDTTPEP